MNVGVRDLKARLSEYLDRAARGEIITVTERGRPKAILGPMPGPSRVPVGIEEGWITPGNGHPPARTRRRFPARRRVADMLDDDRGA